MEPSAAGVVDEVQDIALLLAEGGVDGENSLDEATAFFGMGPGAGLATEDAVANGSLGDVVRRLDTLDVEEGPEGIGAREELLAGPCGLQMRRGYALGQQRLDGMPCTSPVLPRRAVRAHRLWHE